MLNFAIEDMICEELTSFFLLFSFAERNLNPKAACLKRREEEKVEEELPEKRLAPNDLDKAYGPLGISPAGGPMRTGGNRARRGRRSSRGIAKD